MTLLRPGRGYWVQVDQLTKVQLIGPVWDGAMDLQVGWNLVGFPGLSDDGQETSLTSIFRDNFAKVVQMWSYEAGNRQAYIGYDSSSSPKLEALRSVHPGKGYWIYCRDDLSLAPVPSISFSPDGKQLASFPRGVNQIPISIRNTGGGILNWELISTTSWLSPARTNGTTASETDVVMLRVDRSGLPPGEYNSSAGLYYYAGSSRDLIPVQVEMVVPSIRGDFRGAATTTKVNNKPVSLGKVDLHMSLLPLKPDYDDSQFRGFLSREKALLFPKDVTFNGLFSSGTNFSMTTSFVLEKADRNMPPYSEFHQPARTGDPDPHLKDQDSNGNGVLDNANPFPSDITRRITLQGTRVNADRLQGTYLETMEGMLPNRQLVTIEGDFTLDRESFVPSQLTVFFGQSIGSPVPIGGTRITSYTNALTISGDVLIEEVSVSPNITFPLPASVTLQLISPAGQSSYLKGPEDRGPIQPDYSTHVFDGANGNGTWRLIVSWEQGVVERGLFKNWQIRVRGFTSHSLSGFVLTEEKAPVPDARIRLVSGFSETNAVTDASGHFDLHGLTANEYLVEASQIGYEDTVTSVIVNSASVVQNITLKAVGRVAKPIIALPFVGTAGLYTKLQARIPLVDVTALGKPQRATWDFKSLSDRSLIKKSCVNFVGRELWIYATGAFVDLRGQSARALSLHFTRGGSAVHL